MRRGLDGWVLTRPPWVGCNSLQSALRRSDRHRQRLLPDFMLADDLDVLIGVRYPQGHPHTAVARPRQPVTVTRRWLNFAFVSSAMANRSASTSPRDGGRGREAPGRRHTRLKICATIALPNRAASPPSNAPEIPTLSELDAMISRSHSCCAAEAVRRFRDRCATANPRKELGELGLGQLRIARRPARPPRRGTDDQATT
jgi:hypothetical protein